MLSTRGSRHSTSRIGKIRKRTTDIEPPCRTRIRFSCRDQSNVQRSVVHTRTIRHSRNATPLSNIVLLSDRDQLVYLPKVRSTIWRDDIFPLLHPDCIDLYSLYFFRCLIQIRRVHDPRKKMASRLRKIVKENKSFLFLVIFCIAFFE